MGWPRLARVVAQVIAYAVSILITAHSLCVESGYRYADAEAVAQVAVNRSRARGVPLWRVFDRSWNRGFPRACGAPVTPEHLALALRAHVGLLDAPAWADDAVAFVTPRRERGLTRHGDTVAQRWRRRGLERAGVLVHVFYRRRHPVEGCGRR